MSGTAAEASSIPTSLEHHVSTNFLLSVYAIVPVTLVVVFLDVVVMQRWLIKQLPAWPESFLLFALFFEMPHILASTILLADGEYVRHYGKTVLAGGVILLCVVVFGTLIFGEYVMFMGAVFYTMYHVIGQQCGVAKMLLGPTGRVFTVWKVLGIACATIMFTSTMLAEMRSQITAKLGYDLLEILDLGARVSAAVVVSLGAILIARTDRPVAKRYVLAHTMLLMACLCCEVMQYSFFVLLMPRVVHDLTAFAFYIAHDRNRNEKQRVNVFQKLGAWLGLPVYVVTPLFAMILAAPVSYNVHQDPPRLHWIYLFLSAFHFFTESFTWKGNNPHRKFVRLR